MGEQELQHYVPFFILKRFGIGERDRVHAFDKSNDSTFVSSARKVAAEVGLYDFTFNGANLTLEPALSKLESCAASVIEKITTQKQLNLLGAADRETIAEFLSVQLVRTRASMATQSEFAQKMESWLRSQGMPEDYFAEDPAVGDGENALRANLARDIVNAPSHYKAAFLEKAWMLFETSHEHPFILGDHPLVKYNSQPRDLRGNLGLTSKGIEIYFPLSSTLLLGLLCPTVLNDLADGLLQPQGQTAAAVNGDCGGAVVGEEAIGLLCSLKEGRPSQLYPENVKFYNSLQVLYAERFLFSSTNDFSLPSEMIRSQPSIRYGRRVVEATGKF